MKKAALGRGRGRTRPQTIAMQAPGVLPEERDPSLPQSVEGETNSLQSSGKRQRQLKPDDLEELGLKFEYKSAVQPDMPQRPDFGKLGRPIRLVANWFPIQIPSENVYHYDVKIENKRVHEGQRDSHLPDKMKYRCLSTKRNRQVMCAVFAAYEQFKGQYPAYDGKQNLYTRYPLENAPFSVEVSLDDGNSVAGGDARVPKRKRDSFVVSVKPVHKKCLVSTRGVTSSSAVYKKEASCAINLNTVHAFFEGKTHVIPQEALMAVETILRCTPCLKLTPIGRSFFHPPTDNDRCLLGSGQEIWFGYHQSLRLGQWSPAVNIDPSGTAFYEPGPVLDYACSVLNCRRSDLAKKPGFRDDEIVRLTKALKKLNVRVTHLTHPRQYRILRVTREPASKLEFSATSGDRTVNVRVSDYFYEQYNYRLMFPNFPCLQMFPESRTVYLPIELCEIVEGQHYKRKLSDEQLKEMIKFTAIVPKDRFKEICEVVKHADFNNDPYCREFGLRVDTEPMEVAGRVLNAPGVCYSNQQIVMPKEGQWDMRDRQFFKGAVIEKWALLNFSEDCSSEVLTRFTQMLCRFAGDSGIRISSPSIVENIDAWNCRVDIALRNIKNECNADLIVIIIPRGNRSLYGDVKHAAETVLGLTTQCIKDKNVVKCDPSLMRNLCLKINAKMGGVNSSFTPMHKPEVFNKPVIIMGADVTHASPTDKFKPSLAAVVGSIDSFPSRYAVTCRAQTGAAEKQVEEIILDLKSMVMDVLRAFYRNTKGKKPEKIIFYRDGVSEGQFDQVRDREVTAIRDACRSLSSEYQPEITFIVVQKRHHTRFLPYDIRDGLGRCRNIPPGTTVDTKIIHPINFDFFLCSHFGLQGTSRPGHYTVLENDSGFKSDELQALTYYLCYTYVRCTKSISVPAPVMYAHLAAFRTRQHFISQIDENSNSSDSGQTSIMSEGLLDGVKVVDKLLSTMYFV